MVCLFLCCLLFVVFGSVLSACYVEMTLVHAAVIMARLGVMH